MLAIPNGDPLMRLNHINLTVPDVASSREFFETYFGFRCVVEKGRDAPAVLLDESGFVLTLNNYEKATTAEYPGAFHVGFMQDSRERVDEIHKQLVSAGFDVEPPRKFHGAWTFYFRAPGGFLIEVGHQHRQERPRSADKSAHSAGISSSAGKA
jgi:catechol 2,3-dioxygenase-like lactoylglutathione lyase family enzyme